MTGVVPALGGGGEILGAETLVTGRAPANISVRALHAAETVQPRARVMAVPARVDRSK
jgi:hypothetical protein